MTTNGGTIARKTAPTSRMRSPVKAFFTAAAFDGFSEVSSDDSAAGFCGVEMDTMARCGFGEVLKNLRQPRCFRVIAS